MVLYYIIHDTRGFCYNNYYCINKLLYTRFVRVCDMIKCYSMLYGLPVFVTLPVQYAAFCVNEKHRGAPGAPRPNRKIRHIYQIAPRRGPQTNGLYSI